MDIVNIDTVVVGGGQAGLSASYYLKEHKINHVILEQSDQPAYAWRNQKWDSFCFVVPNWTINLPGGSYNDFGIDPDGFISRDELIRYFEKYIEIHQLPIKFNSKVSSIKQSKEGWRVITMHTTYLVDHVIISTGFFQSPKLPNFSDNIDTKIQQLHTSNYKNTQQLKDGAVLVVGTGQSGMQIAEEIYKSGRKVHLAIGSTGRMPRRYRGRDIIYWWNESGNFTKKVELLKSPKERFGSNPQCTGIDGGHDLTFHQFFIDGVLLYGHLTDISPDGTTAIFADNLHKLIKYVDDFEDNMLTIIDKSIIDLELEVSEPPSRNMLTNAYDQELILTLNFDQANITNIIWATGYTRDFSYIEAELPVIDDTGFPLQHRGVNENKGLFFHGMPWISNSSSGLVYGVGKDAEYLVDYIVNH